MLHLPPRRDSIALSRRRLFAAAAALGAYGVFGQNALAAMFQDASLKTGVDPEKWNPETIQALAGTNDVDTAEFVHNIVAADAASGALQYWNAGPTEASPQVAIEFYAEFQKVLAELYPNVQLENQNIGYNDLLDKIRTAAAGGAAPDVAKMPILWGVEFAARGQLQEIVLEDFGLNRDLYWDGALKSVTWDGKMYGIPTNNETMAFIWNKQIFADAGLDPETPPATWDEVVAFSNQIKQETGVSGFGLVARVNAGNTPFRFMPMLWAYGSGALDEAEAEPKYEGSMINNEGGIAALQAAYDMYVRDQSVPTSALTNTQTENGDLFISGQVAMMISHPSEYVGMTDRASKATGSDKELADQVVANMSYGLIPEGPVRRAVVFGGSNIHMLSDEAHGKAVNLEAAKGLIAATQSPEWAVKNVWTDSNPGNLMGFETSAMKQRLEDIRFLEVTTSMLPYGIPFPVVPEATEIMNIIVPEMLQNALTESMSVQEAADNAANEINALVSSW